MDDWYPEEEEQGYYDTAQICLNGHVINRNSKGFPQHNSKHCSQCGKATTTICTECNTDIRGHYNAPGFFSSDNDPAPSYCHNCGHPYPWTEARIAAANELTDEAENLSSEEKEQLKSTFDDLVKETPRTPVAVTKYKRLTQKAGSIVADTLKSILVEIMVAYAKKGLGF